MNLDRSRTRRNEDESHKEKMQALVMTVAAPLIGIGLFAPFAALLEQL
jgi:hypothetical protein